MKILADVGELGWAMYLSAHVNWLKEQGHECLVYTDRPSMYECSTSSVPIKLKEELKDYPADGFGRYGIGDDKIRSYFKDLAGTPKYCCDRSVDWTTEKTIYKPYNIEPEYKRPYIAVCPRCRPDEHHKIRNLSKEFYTELIQALLRHGYEVISLGSKGGSYNIHIKNNNYINLHGATSIEKMIGLLTGARACIGGTSAPPKIAALQGTPAYVIGHEKHRFQVEENWSKTNVGFYEIRLEDYRNINIEKVIEGAIKWLVSAI